jgi:hypothetical protein
MLFPNTYLRLRFTSSSCLYGVWEQGANGLNERKWHEAEKKLHSAGLPLFAKCREVQSYWLCSLFNDAFSVTKTKFYNAERKSDKWMMNWNKFGTTRSWSNYKVLPWHSRGGAEKNHETIAGLHAKIWIQDLPNTKQEWWDWLDM